MWLFGLDPRNLAGNNRGASEGFSLTTREIKAQGGKSPQLEPRLESSPGYWP